jgi:hypothetical protein
MMAKITLKLLDARITALEKKLKDKKSDVNNLFYQRVDKVLDKVLK